MAKRRPTGILSGDGVTLDISDAVNELHIKSCFGAKISEKKLKLSLLEAAYLLSKEKIIVKDSKKKRLDASVFIRMAQRHEKKFFSRFSVFRNMRDRGYVVKTALKFGGDFRVYDRGVRPGEDHARWILYPVNETDELTWYDFAAKNRVAHSTKKRLMIGVTDEEGDVTYYEIRWMRP